MRHPFGSPGLSRLAATLAAAAWWLCCMIPQAAADETARGRILVLGDSLTAGYGLSPEEAYPRVLQKKIDEAGLPFEVVNAGLSGETSAGGLRRINWLLRRPVELLVLALGSNDALRGIDPETTQANLIGIVRKVRSQHPDLPVLIVGQRAPPNLGTDYARRFDAVFAVVAKETGAGLVPFLLEGVAGNPELNLPDGIHPNAEGHRLLADNIWPSLKALLCAGSSPDCG